jgi:pyruvate dehydrogenase complex dehydrogenase (E1) component
MMNREVSKGILELDEMETLEWLDSLDYVIGRRGPERSRKIRAEIVNRAMRDLEIDPEKANPGSAQPHKRVVRSGKKL